MNFMTLVMLFIASVQIIAHSGTIMGLLFPSDYTAIDECRAYIEKKYLHYDILIS